MTDYPRREMIKIMGAGLAASSIAGKALAFSGKESAPMATASDIKVVGSMPMTAELNEVMFENRALLNQLVAEFLPRAKQMLTNKAFWLAFNAWVANRLTELALTKPVDAKTLGEYAWIIHATSYWGGVEYRKHWGLPAAFNRPDIKRPVASEIQAMLTTKLKQSLVVINAGADACLDYLPTLMHDDSTTGTIFTIAYNSGCQLVKTEDPPLGQRRPHRPEMPGAIRIYSRSFMRVDYDLPNFETPAYLKRWRSNLEKAIVDHADSYEQVLSGGQDQTDLRVIWKRGVEYGNITWGGNANDHWEPEYYDETVHWACVLGLGLEAVAQASLVAALGRDTASAQLAVIANAVFIGETFGWGVGMSDDDGQLPVMS